MGSQRQRGASSLLLGFFGPGHFLVFLLQGRSFSANWSLGGQASIWFSKSGKCNFPANSFPRPGLLFGFPVRGGGDSLPSIGFLEPWPLFYLGFQARGERNFHPSCLLSALWLCTVRGEHLPRYLVSAAHATILFSCCGETTSLQIGLWRLR